MKILGIETSCDETAAAVIENGTKILSNVVASSLELHAKTGGIIPEVAAREQLKSIIPVIETSLKNAKLSTKDVDAIAVTNGPGLIGSLFIGVETAKTLAYSWSKPIVPTNHLFGHIYANWLENPNPPAFPTLALLVSGGHTELVLLHSHDKFEWLGGTRDDAAGECFDKTARLLGLPYPGGPQIQKAAEKAENIDNSLPRPMSDSKDFDFSFSGLKSDVARRVADKTLSQQEVCNLAASIQAAVVDSLLIKTKKAVEKYKVKEVLLAGGVAANKHLQEEAKKRLQVKVYSAPPRLCTDNGAMIGAAAFFQYKPVPWQEIKADSGLFF